MAHGIDCAEPAGVGANKIIDEIRARFDAYKAHRDDPYVYDQREIFEVKEFYACASADIEFLLQWVDNTVRNIIPRR